MNFRKKYLLSLLLLLFPIQISAATKGEIKDSLITQEDDTIIIKKEVTKTTEEDVFNIKFTINASEKANEKKNYIIVIFDRSGSMLCNNGTTKSKSLFSFQNAGIINNQQLYCSPLDEIKSDKWKNAVDGTIQFSKDITDNQENIYLKLITFATDITTQENWTNTSFLESDFSYPNGDTNLKKALEQAKEEFSTIDKDNNKYIVIIGDGEVNDKEEVKNLATELKETTKIFTIGYELNNDGKTTLEEIASKTEYFKEASTTDITAELKKIIKEMNNIPIATNLTLTDILPKEFSYLDSEESTLKIEDNKIIYELPEIKKEEKTINFNVQIDKDSKTGWYKTNDISNNEVKLTYTKEKEEKTIIINNSSQVYWEQQLYKYIIKYYKDEISDVTFLGMTEGNLPINTILEEENIEINKYLPEGYEKAYTDKLPYTIKEENNIVNVVYKKEIYPYKIEYYKDTLDEQNKIRESSESYREYQTVITEDILKLDFGENFKIAALPEGYQFSTIENIDMEITKEENVIKILYTKRNDLSYKVEYYYDDQLEDVKEYFNQTYNETITEYELNNKKGYEFVKVENTPLTISLDKEKNVIKVFYESTDEILPPKTSVQTTNLSTISSVILIIVGIATYKFISYISKERK